jgi:hypothetical protein
MAAHSGSHRIAEAIFQSSAYKALSREDQIQFITQDTSGGLNAMEQAILENNKDVFQVCIMERLKHLGKREKFISLRSCLFLPHSFLNLNRVFPELSNLQEITLVDVSCSVENLVEILSQAKQCKSLYLHNMDLRSLTTDHISSLPSLRHIEILSLEGSMLSPDVLLALLSKTGSIRWAFESLDLDALTIGHVNALPEGIQIQSINIVRTHIKAEVLIALLAKIETQQMFLYDVDLSDLTSGHIQQLLDGIHLKFFRLTKSKINPDALVAFFIKIKSEEWDLQGCDLSHLTVEHVQQLPDGIQLHSVNSSACQLNSDVLFSLLTHINSEEWTVNAIDLRGFTVAQILKISDSITIDVSTLGPADAAIFR